MVAGLPFKGTDAGVTLQVVLKTGEVHCNVTVLAIEFVGVSVIVVLAVC